MSNIAIITAIYDHYDSVKPILPQIDTDAEWVLVTGNEDTAKEAEELGWRAVVEPQPDLHPNRAAKRPKLLPWKYTDASTSIWVDASFRVVSETFAADAMVYANPIAQFKHPWRDCLWDEAVASCGIPKYFNQPISRQALQYRSEGHPANWGLWASGIIARRHHPIIRMLGDEWKGQIDNWSFQDQISQPFVLRKLGLRPREFPGTHLANDWLVYEGSGRH
jgi:hypothetical protein